MRPGRPPDPLHCSGRSHGLPEDVPGFVRFASPGRSIRLERMPRAMRRRIERSRSRRFVEFYFSFSCQLLNCARGQTSTFTRLKPRYACTEVEAVWCNTSTGQEASRITCSVTL